MAMLRNTFQVCTISTLFAESPTSFTFCPAHMFLAKTIYSKRLKLS